MSFVQKLTILILMVSASFSSAILKPKKILADDIHKVDFEKIVPSKFGDWSELSATGIVVADPLQEMALKLFYSQTVSRVYVNRDGYKIMLSIAYGEVQTDSMRVHSPEICYPAQGFAIQSSGAETLEFPGGRRIPVTNAVASLNGRIEPMTYLILVGDKASAAGVDRKFAQLEYGLRGLIPDGLLVRVSSIDSDVIQALKKQRTFMVNLYEEVAPENRVKLFGVR